ncbi:hypothetical protein, partial [Hyalangium versicolor]|uniref:hypothetical protein n=1 Tax=Hyalangium versicolor TaxID=2861190 RepID=UPI001CC9A213
MLQRLLIAAGMVVTGGALALLTRAPDLAALTRALPSHARQYARAISKAAKASGVDALLLAAVLEQES